MAHLTNTTLYSHKIYYGMCQSCFFSFSLQREYENLVFFLSRSSRCSFFGSVSVSSILCGVEIFNIIMLTVQKARYIRFSSSVAVVVMFLRCREAIEKIPNDILTDLFSFFLLCPSLHSLCMLYTFLVNNVIIMVSYAQFT